MPKTRIADFSGLVLEVASNAARDDPNGRPHDPGSSAPLRTDVDVKTTLLKNAAANLGRLGSGWLILLIIPPLLTRSLSKPAYAAWMLVLQLGAYVAFVQGGVEAAICRFVARSEHTGDTQHQKEILTAAGLLLVLCTGLLSLTTLFGWWNMSRLFPDIPKDIAQGARTALLILGIAYCINLPMSLLGGVFQGYQKNEINALAVGIGRIVSAIGVAWVAVQHQGLVRMAAWTGLGVSVQSSLLGLWWWTTGKKPNLLPIQLRLRAVKEFAIFCSSMLVAQFSGLLITGLDLPIVAAFDFHTAGYYAAAATACNMFAVPHIAVLSTLIPVASGVTATESRERVGQILVRVTRYSTAMLCTASIALIYGMKAFLGLWLGVDYAAHTALFAVILIMAQLVRLSMFPYAIMGFGAGQQGRMLLSALGEGLVNLAFSLIAVRVYGALGVALGTLVGAVVGVLLHFWNSIPRTDSIVMDRRRLLWEGILRPLTISIPASLAALIFALILKSPVSQVAAFLVAGLGIAASQWRFTLARHERREVIELVGRYYRKVLATLQPARAS